MINLRYHIVSITAVFLALGIGITMGSGFLQDAAVDRIDRNVENARRRVEEVTTENDRLRDAVERTQARDEEFTDQAPERLFAGRVEDVPVVLIAAAGVDEDSLDDLRSALSGSAAAFEGTIVATEKLRLEGDDAAEMADALDAASTDRVQLQRIVASRVARELQAVSDDPDPSGNGTTTTTTTATTRPNGTTPTTLPSRPELIPRLIEDGFLSYTPAEGGVDVEELLTAQGYRYVVVTGPEPELADGDFLGPLLTAMTADEPASVVVASAAGGDDPEATRTIALAPWREDEVISERISTVDDLGKLPGIAAVVLCLDDLGRNLRGHYGVGEGAEAQLPPLQGG